MADQLVRMIPVHKIHPNPDNPRYEAGDVSGLAASIKADGLKQPLLVIATTRFEPGDFLIEDGYRRWVAGKTVCKELPCIVTNLLHPAESLAFRELITAAITDVHKAYLPAMDRARQYGRLRDEFGMNQSQIAERIGVTDGTISRYLALLELSAKSQQDVRDRKLKVEDAVQAVQKHRTKARQKQGKKPIDVGWGGPDPFNDSHPLAKRAAIMCEAREHIGRRKFVQACHACWETVIRQDEDKVIAVQYKEAGLTLTFLPPAISPDGAVRANGVTGAE